MKRFSSHSPYSFAYLPALPFAICQCASRSMIVAPNTKSSASTNLQHLGTDADRPGSRQQDDTHIVGGLLTVQQAAQKCQLSVRHIRRMIKSGILPVIRFGKAVRIHPKHLGL
jgi:excisionase family DNA binding protein